VSKNIVTVVVTVATKVTADSITENNLSKGTVHASAGAECL